MANRRVRPERAHEPKDLDAIDLRILSELQRGARVSLAELGRRVGLSAPAVGERVQRLEDSGVITGYHAEVDPRMAGFPVTLMVRVRPAVRELSRIAKIAQEIPEIVECQRYDEADFRHRRRGACRGQRTRSPAPDRAGLAAGQAGNRGTGRRCGPLTSGEEETARLRAAYRPHPILGHH